MKPIYPGFHSALRCTLWAFLIAHGAPAVFAQCALSCNQNLQVSLDASGTAPISVSVVAPAAGSTCPGNLSIELYNEFGQSLPNPLTCDQIGVPVTAVVRHQASGNSCSGTLAVHDFLPPDIQCPERFVWCNQASDPVALGYPTASDNCTSASGITLEWVDNTSDLPCGTMQAGMKVLRRIDRSWTATDANGNTRSCVQKVWIKHISLSDISFPPNLNGIQQPALNCGQNPEDLELTGQPTVEGFPIENGINCETGIAYSDQQIPFCPPAGYTVLRTWTAVDYCAGTVTSRLQTIKIQDITPPVLTPPANLTVSTAPFACTAVVSLPTASASDDCSSVSIQAQWNFGVGYGPFSAVPPGDHLVVYVATDACGNSATANMTITVEDQVPPQAVCPLSVQVSLTGNGQAMLQAGALDGGSSDYCGPVSFSISRDSGVFLPEIPFSCADLGAPVPVVLRVSDAAGLENFCESAVLVRDLLKPSVQCPPNITLNCLQDYQNQQITGMAIASDNCQVNSFTFQDVVNLQACNTGAVTRSWTATDPSGNSRSCAQVITMTAVSTVTVDFPTDITINTCVNDSLLMPDQTGYPQIGGVFCAPLSIQYEDEILTTPGQYCLRVVRTWTVTDWCVYDQNSNAGRWVSSQLISVLDNLPPQIQTPADITLQADPATCKAIVSLGNAAAVDCLGLLPVTHNSLYAALPGDNASGEYPIGVHVVVFEATDQCGNSAQKTIKITVTDNTPPFAQCLQQVPVQILPGGWAPLSAASFNNNSYDACTPVDSLLLTTTVSGFNCAQLGAQNLVLLVTDPAGNMSFCGAGAIVTDPDNICLGSQEFMIGGQLRTETGAPVQNTPVMLSTDGLSLNGVTDSLGNFHFVDVPGGDLYELKPHNDAIWLNGVSTFDLVLISKHILGVELIGSPYKLMAADANRNGLVTATDIVQFRRLILGLTDSIAGNDSWRFIPADFTFSNPQNPFVDTIPEKILFPLLQSDQNGQDFIGVKVGDVNGNADAADPRDPSDSLTLLLSTPESVPGNADHISVVLPGWANLDGFQFELVFDTNVVHIEDIVFRQESGFGPGFVAIKKNRVRVSWNKNSEQNMVWNDTIFAIKCIKKREILHADWVILQDDRIKPEAYLAEQNSLQKIILERNKHGNNNENIYWNALISPNPVISSAQLHIWAPDAGKYQLGIYNSAGSLCLENTLEAPAGHSAAPLLLQDLPAGGLYFFRLTDADGNRIVGRFVRQAP